MYTGLNQNYFSTWEKQVEIFQNDENRKSGWLSLSSLRNDRLCIPFCVDYTVDCTASCCGTFKF